MASSNSTAKVKARTLNASGPMDVYEVLSTDSTSTYALRDAHASIVCKGIADNNPLEYQVKLTAYANEANLLQTDGLYILKSRLIAPNVEDSIPRMFYESDHAMLATTSKEVKSSLANNTAVSGLGLIVERFTIQEEAFDKPTVVAIIEHSDYENGAREMITFNVAYYIRPVRNLLSMQALFQVNKEAVVSGYIVDYDADNNRFICDVTGINLTNGPESSKASSSAVKVEDTIQTPDGRPRGKFFKKVKSNGTAEKHALTADIVEDATVGKPGKKGKKAV